MTGFVPSKKSFARHWWQQQASWSRFMLHWAADTFTYDFGLCRTSRSHSNNLRAHILGNTSLSSASRSGFLAIVSTKSCWLSKESLSREDAGRSNLPHDLHIQFHPRDLRYTRTAGQQVALCSNMNAALQPQWLLTFFHPGTDPGRRLIGIAGKG